MKPKRSPTANSKLKDFPVPGAILAAGLGVTIRRIRQMADQGIAVRLGHDSYDLVTTLRNVRQLRNGHEKLPDVRLRDLVAAARIKEAKAAALERRYVARDDLEDAVQRLGVELAAQLDGVAGRIAAEVVAETRAAFGQAEQLLQRVDGGYHLDLWAANVQGLHEAGVGNVSVLVGDGTLGWSAYAPYHAILVAAGGPAVPPPLAEQLAPGGRLLIPLGAKGGAQVLTLVERTPAGLVERPLGEARFVPLIGEHGFDA